MKSPTVIGLYQPMTGKGKDRVAVGKPISGLYEPIIDAETFYAAQKATKGRFRTRTTKNPPSYNLWQKVLKCSLCHAAMNLYTKGPKQPPYFRCYEAAKGACKAKAIRVDRTERAFRELLTKVNSLALVQNDARSLQSRLYEVQGRIAEQQQLIAESREVLLTRRAPTLLAMIADADDEIARLQSAESELEQALAANAITDKEDFLARVDLTSYEGRARANELLKRLNILVTAVKVEDTITYVVYKKELRILTMTDTDAEKPVHVKPYSGTIAEAMYRQGEIGKDDLFVSPGFNRRLKKPGTMEPVPKRSTEPGPDWGSYDETLPDEAYDLVDEKGNPVFSSDTYRDEYSIPDENGNFPQYEDEGGVLYAPND